MDTGTIVYLNGPSSSGKNTIVSAFQGIMDEPWFSIGVDTWFASVPRRFIGEGPEAATGFPWVFDHSGILIKTATGPAGNRLMRGLFATVAALAATGNNVIVDDVMYESWMAGACARRLSVCHAYFIGVHCPLELCEAREQARGDRPRGLASCNHHLVHRGATYDVDVDTSRASAEICATRIKAYLDAGHSPRAFRTLASRDGGREMSDGQ